jgi:hypothetical protein
MERGAHARIWFPGINGSLLREHDYTGGREKTESGAYFRADGDGNETVLADRRGSHGQ